jgi:hypothetical protein
MRKRPLRSQHAQGVFPSRPDLTGDQYVKEVAKYIEKFSRALSLAPAVYVVRGQRITA